MSQSDPVIFALKAADLTDLALCTASDGLPDQQVFITCGQAIINEMGLCKLCF
jgi:hypothetical protein